MKLAVVGPTAAGKTALSLRIAESVGAEVVSCDSMQLYRGFDIGTAKPTAEERARVPHHLLDVVEADEAFSAARYVSLADAAIAAIHARGKRALIVGGTGLYLRALRFGLVDAPARDESLRRQFLDEEAARPGILHLRLRAVDPESAARLSPNDLVRVVRALEVHAKTGVPLGKLHKEHARAPRHEVRVLVLDPPDELLQSRIAARVEIMLAGGLIEETRLLAARFGRECRALGALGYAEVLQYLDGKLRFGELAPAIVRSTRKYARRQRTWFRKEPGAQFFGDADALHAAALR